MIAPPLRYALQAAAVLAPCAILAQQGARATPAAVLLVVAAVALSAWMALAYAASVRKAVALAQLRPQARPVWAPLLGGALVRQVLAVPVALLVGWGVAYGLIADGWTGFARLIAAAVILHVVARILVRQTTALRPYARLRPIVLLAPILAAIVLAIGEALVTGLAAGGGGLIESLRALPRHDGASALLGWAVDATALATGARAVAAGWLEQQAAPVAVLWRAASLVVEAGVLTQGLAAALLPAGEAGRILRTSDADVPPPPGSLRLMAAGVVGALVLMSLATALGPAEAWAQTMEIAAAPRPDAATLIASPQPGTAEASPGLMATAPDPPPLASAPRLPTPSSLRAAIEAERLGDLLCPPGTIQAALALDADIGAILERQRATVEVGLRRGFDAMRGNVDGYLDWHYSLTARYVELYVLLFETAPGVAEDALAGTIEDRTLSDMERRFAEHLGAGEPFAALDASLEGLAGNELLLNLHAEARAALMRDCGPDLPSDDGPTILLASSEDLPPPSVPAFAEGLRLSGAGLPTGALAGAVLGKLVLGKIAATAGFKAVAAAVAKFALAKSGGWLAGAMVGGGVGAVGCSWVPVLGTSACAVVGGIVGGVAAGLAVDALAVEAEEAIWREGYRGEIIAAIDAAEAEALAALDPTEPMRKGPP